MRVVTRLPYKLSVIDGTMRPDEPRSAFVIKGAFDLVHGRPARPLPAEEQIEICGDQPFLDEIGRSLRVASDFVMFKPFGEVTLRAECHAPGGIPVLELEAGFRIGTLAKRLRVSGDRVWYRNARGELQIDGPRAFVSLPLRWERAFGGLSVPENPIGRGIDPWPAPQGGRHLFLPNVEHPARRVAGPQDRPPPAGFAPISPNWQPRLKRQGTRDAHWATFVAPLPPADYDLAATQTAPDDQWVDGYWRGDETVELSHLHQERERLLTALPGLRLRLFVEPATAPDQPTRFVEMPLDLDTLHLDTTTRVVTLVWRRHFRPAHQDLRDLRFCYLAEEALADPPSPIEFHRQEYLALRGPEASSPEAQMLRDEAAALAQARKTLVDAGVDPAFISRFDAAPDSTAKHGLVMDLVKSRTAELEAMTRTLGGP